MTHKLRQRIDELREYGESLIFSDYSVDEKRIKLLVTQQEIEQLEYQLAYYERSMI